MTAAHGCSGQIRTLSSTSCGVPDRNMGLKDVFAEFLAGYVPGRTVNGQRPFVTLTYAASLDSCIASAPNTRTAISHEETKEMTQYLRSVHDGILVGCGTAMADDPGLNCKAGLEYSPRPIIVDPNLRWAISETSKVIRLAKSGEGLGPWLVCRQGVRAQFPDRLALVQSVGGDIIELPSPDTSFDFDALFSALAQRGLKSVMVEGGAQIIAQLLALPQLVDSLVVTVAPVYFGTGGVRVSPDRAARLCNVKWFRGTTDVVLAANMEPLRS